MQTEQTQTQRRNKGAGGGSSERSWLLIQQLTMLTGGMAAVADVADQVAGGLSVHELVQAEQAYNAALRQWCRIGDALADRVRKGVIKADATAPVVVRFFNAEQGGVA